MRRLRSAHHLPRSAHRLLRSAHRRRSIRLRHSAVRRLRSVLRPQTISADEAANLAVLLPAHSARRLRAILTERRRVGAPTAWRLPVILTRSRAAASAGLLLAALPMAGLKAVWADLRKGSRADLRRTSAAR